MTAAVATLKTELLARAHELGFALCRVARADAPRHADSFVAWLSAGQAGDMAGWLGRSREKRINPQLVLPDVRSIVVLAMNYWQGEQTTTSDLHPSAFDSPARGRIARYAWG